MASHASIVKQLQNDYKDYVGHLRGGMVGEALGAAGGESPMAAAARKAFADKVAQIDPNQAQIIMESALEPVPSRMKKVLDSMNAKVQTELDTAQNVITPDMQNRPEFKGVKNLVGQLPASTGKQSTPKNQLNLSGPTAVVKGNRDFTNPAPPPTGALGAPVQPMAPPPAAQPMPAAAGPAAVPPPQAQVPQGPILGPNFFDDIRQYPPQPAAGAPLR